MSDRFETQARGLIASAEASFAITPSDESDLPEAIRQITLTSGGTLRWTESKGALLSMRFEVFTAEQRLYRNGELILTTNEEDANLGALGNGLGLRLGSIATGWTSETGAPLRAIRVGAIPR